MKTIRIIICFFLCSTIFFPIYSQELRKPINKELRISPFPKKNLSGVTAVTVSKDDRSKDMIPAKDAERFKIKIEIESNKDYFGLIGEQFEYGKHKENILGDNIAERHYLKKGEQVFFELVPDVSKSNNLILFTYCSGMTCFNYMNCSEDKYIKYNMFEKTTKVSTDIVPLLLLYVDDKENKVKKEVDKYLNRNSSLLLPDKYEKLLEKIPHCMLVYYRIR